jgi:hypothetical protein
MSEELPQPPGRSYGCTFGCGRPYDFILVTVQDSSTEFLCMVCLITLSRDMINALADQGSNEMLAALAYAADEGNGQVPGPTAKPGRRNAPVGTEDDDTLSAFDSIIEGSELSEEFQ